MDETYNSDYVTDDTDMKIDNSDLSYVDKNICIKLNNKSTSKISKSEKVLCNKFPKLKEIPAEARMERILTGLFPEGFLKHMYIRNLTFTHRNNGSDVKMLGIRPERTPGDFLDSYIPSDMSLLFKGYISGKEFIVNSIYEVANTEQLDFEVDVVATPYENREKIHSNFLYDILDKAGSLTGYTEEKLKEWKEYLQWKTELAQLQIYGCKYYKVAFDDTTKRLNFWLVFEDKDAFTSFRKYLGRDIQVFDNNYSKDKWHFNFAGDIANKRQKFNSVELGRYRGVVSEYYLKANVTSSDKNEALNEEDIHHTYRLHNEGNCYFDENEDTDSEEDIYDEGTWQILKTENDRKQAIEAARIREQAELRALEQRRIGDGTQEQGAAADNGAAADTGAAEEQAQ